MHIFVIDKHVLSYHSSHLHYKNVCLLYFLATNSRIGNIIYVNIPIYNVNITIILDLVHVKDYEIEGRARSNNSQKHI